MKGGKTSVGDKNPTPTGLRFGREAENKIKPFVPAASYGILRFLFRSEKIKQIGEIAMEFFFRFLRLFIEDWQSVSWYLLICSVIGIALTGSIKIPFIKKIENEHLKKCVLFNMGLVVTAAIGAAYIFWTDQIGFDYYFSSIPFLCVTEIVLYAFYENELIRDIYQNIAYVVCGKFCPTFAKALISGEKKEETQKKVAEDCKSVKTEIAKVVKSASNDFENL